MWLKSRISLSLSVYPAVYNVMVDTMENVRKYRRSIKKWHILVDSIVYL